MRDETKVGSALQYEVGGFALGAVCGLLFAPKKGGELREDIGAWGRRSRERGEQLLARAGEYIPHKAKAVGAAADAVIKTGEQAYRDVKGKIDDALKS